MGNVIKERLRNTRSNTTSLLRHMVPQTFLNLIRHIKITKRMNFTF